MLMITMMIRTMIVMDFNSSLCNIVFINFSLQVKLKFTMFSCKYTNKLCVWFAFCQFVYFFFLILGYLIVTKKWPKWNEVLMMMVMIILLMKISKCNDNIMMIRCNDDVHLYSIRIFVIHSLVHLFVANSDDNCIWWCTYM